MHRSHDKWQSFLEEIDSYKQDDELHEQPDDC